MKYYKLLVSSFSLIIIMLLFLSNAAQPGVWNAGGGGYHLLFPEDSLSFKKIQMHSEKISMQLYPGFAIVKGEYQMKNETSDTVSIKVGYPVNGIYEGNHFGKLNLVTFDGLYKIKAIQEGKVLPIIEKPIVSEQTNSETFNNENWYVWENTFSPNKTTAIDVYFMVNTNNAHIREGYNKDNHNAFIYLLESGNVWKQPITNAEFKVELKEGLTLEDVHGISQSLDWKKNTNEASTILIAEKNSFSPTPKDNIVINYGERIEEFDFLATTEKAEHYFNEINEFSKIDIENLTNYQADNPYDVSSSGLYSFIMSLFFLIPSIFLTALIYFIIRYIILKKYGVAREKKKALVYHILGLIFSVLSLMTISFWAYLFSLIVAVPSLILGLTFTVNAQKSWLKNSFTLINYFIIIVTVILGIISLILTK